MANRKLSRLKGLPPDLISKLGCRGIITCKDFLVVGPLDLMDILDLTYPSLQDLVSAVSLACAPSAKTVLSMHQERATAGMGFLSTSIPKLDSILKGGLPPYTVTEVSGPPGSGKTQFCLMLSVQSSLPVTVGGRGSPVIYIDTEGAFSAERLIEMARCRVSAPLVASPASHPVHSPPKSQDRDLLEMARKVHVYRKMTCRSFLECLEGLDVVIASKGAGLVVVDSIASLVRKEFDVSTNRGAMERTAMLLKQSARLRYLAESCGVQVLVTNQVVTNLSQDRHEPSVLLRARGGGGGVVTSALGNAWYHSMNTRLLLDYGQDQLRQLTVIKSPLCERSSILVGIERSGFVFTPPILTDNDSRLHRQEPAAMNNLTAAGSVHFPNHRGFSVEFPGQ